MQGIQLYCWQFMAYPYLPDDFDEKYESGWVTVPNSLWDREKSRGLFQEYIDQMAYADQIGFDGVVLNEHHQNVYGLMPSPNIIAAALTQVTEKAKIVLLGNLLPLHLNPLRIAEEYAMIDYMSDGRLIAGFAVGGGPEAFNYNVPQPQSRGRFWEAIDVIEKAWTQDGPFEHEGRYYPLRYVNIWPKPLQLPRPPIWIPGALSAETIEACADRGYSYFLSSRVHDMSTRRAVDRFADAIERHGDRYHPYRMGLLQTIYVADTDEQARQEADEGIWYFLRNCIKGHLRSAGRLLTFGPGVPSTSVKSWRSYLENTNADTKLLGDAENWEDLNAWNAVIAGSPETVREKLWKLIEDNDIGYLLIQFQFGNLDPELARKSMKLFSEKVAPSLRRDSIELFARRFPHMQEQLSTEGAAQ